MVLVESNDIIDDAFRRVPTALTFTDLFGVAAPFLNEVDDIEHSHAAERLGKPSGDDDGTASRYAGFFQESKQRKGR